MNESREMIEAKTTTESQRLVHEVEPTVRVVSVLHDAHESFLQFSRDRSWFSFADGQAVDRLDRRNLGGCPGEENFVCDVEHLPRYMSFRNRKTRVLCEGEN